MAHDLIGRIADGSRVTIAELAAGMSDGTLTSEELVGAYVARYTADLDHEFPLNGFVEIFESASARARAADRARAEGDTRPFLGVPIAVKDNIQIRGETVTCASNILDGYRAPYSATVIERLLDAGFVLLGRTNMDEFAMGSSCEYTRYGPSRNPADRTRICGGSSGGSAAVVASGQAPVALGSDTGGSVRLPAAFCGVYGFKPTYGVQSRYGLVAFGSSLDQIGYIAHSPADISAMLSVTAGRDPRDETSVEFSCPAVLDASADAIDGLTVGIPREFVGEGTAPEVRAVFESWAADLESRGATVEECSLPVLEAGIAIYYIIAPAEASSNLSRFDGVKYGYRDRDVAGLREMYERTRMAGFGDEVKRRILVGNYVLSSGYYDAYYKKAQAVRKMLREEVTRAFERYDLLLSPTAPTPPFQIGERVDDPVAMYLTDLCTTFANLAGVPALSIPAGETESGLPVGVQIAGPRLSDHRLLSVAGAMADSGGFA